MTIKKPELMASLLTGAATLGLLSTLAFANHVTVTAPAASEPPSAVVVPGTIPTPPAPVVTPPAGAPVVVVPRAEPQPQMQTLQVDDIRAHVVRAQTIYANQIDADQVQGMINQSKAVKVRDTKGELRAPEVAAAVIYADNIKANRVVADQIFVRDLRLHK